MKYAGLVLLAVLVLPLSADLYFLDHPAPVSLKHGEFLVGGRLQSGGGIIARGGVGLFDRVTLGISYSVDNFFGHESPTLPPLEAIGFQARLLGLEEGQSYPSIMVGFESQGYDGYDSSRFVTLPPGAFLLLGKTFWSARTEVSLAAKYKPPPGSSGFDGHLAVRGFFFPDWDIILEYDPALNDNPARFRTVPGLLNFGIARTFNGNLCLKLGLRDILGYHPGYGLNRTFDISFQQHF